MHANVMLAYPLVSAVILRPDKMSFSDGASTGKPHTIHHPSSILPSQPRFNFTAPRSTYCSSQKSSDICADTCFMLRGLCASGALIMVFQTACYATFLIALRIKMITHPYPFGIYAHASAW